MDVNKDLPHVLVLPEDDANRQLSNGFRLEIDFIRQRQMQVLPVADGWRKVLDRFQSDQIRDMERYPNRFMVLLIDLDGQEKRLEDAKAAIPEHLTDRVFVLCTLGEPEDLKRAGLGHFETIGSLMAKDCREETDTTWEHDLLQHNKGELDRLREHVRPILF
jgi:hypothetical protein